MQQNLKWMFAENQVDAIQGPNDPGIANFAGDRATAIIREAIQNSLDARQGESPVTISFDRKMLDKSILATDDLLQHIEWSIESSANDEENKPDFKNAKSLLGGGVKAITCLCITDRNTTGAIDKEDDDISPWKALTKGSGFPRKTSKKATGSYGIGKFASFTATYLRTVFYSTAFVSNDGLEHRFQGKTILVSHKDSNGKKLQNIGYLGDGFDPLKDQAVPAQVRMKEPGTSLYIPYYRFGRIGQWLHDSTAIVLENFFHAIVHGNLQVHFKDSAKNEFPTRTIDKRTSNKYQRIIAEDSINFRLLQVSKMEPRAEKTFQNVGDISIRIDINQNTNWRDIGLVRDAGMLITKNKRDMFPGIKKIPAHWWGFTAIIECQSRGKSLLRSAESPRHDHISSDYIRDTDMRSSAEEIFKEVGNWCFEEIRKIAEPDVIGESVNADELTPWLGINSDDTNALGGDQGSNVDGEPVVTVPERAFRSPSLYKKQALRV